MNDKPLDFDFELSPQETAAMFTIHRAEMRIAELMGRAAHPDPLRTMLAIGIAWLHRVEAEGGCDAMAAALLTRERGDDDAPRH